MMVAMVPRFYLARDAIGVLPSLVDDDGMPLAARRVRPARPAFRGLPVRVIGAAS